MLPGLRALAVVVALGVIVGGGVLAHKADAIYLSGRVSVALAAPSAFIAGGNGSLLVAVTDHEGAPVVGERVRVHAREDPEPRLLAEGETDDRGIAALAFRVPESAGTMRLVVAVASEVFEESVRVESARAVHVITDRVAYRPGDEVQARILLVGGTPPQAMSGDVNVSFTDPRGVRVLEMRLRTDSSGVAAFTIPLGEAARDGEFRLRAVSGAALGESVVSVSSARAPRFTIAFEEAPSFLTPRDPLNVNLAAFLAPGVPVMGDAAVTVSVLEDTWRLLGVKQGRLENGRLAISIDLEDVRVGSAGSLVALRGVVHDGVTRENVTRYIPIAREPLEIGVFADAVVFGANVTARVVAAYPDGTPAEGAVVNATLGGKRVRSAVTDERGLATLSAPFEGALALVVTADLGNGTRGVREVTLPEPTNLGVSAVAPRVVAGETARFLVNRASSEEAALYYEVHAHGVLEASGRLLARGTTIPLEFETTARMAPVVRVSVFEVGQNLHTARAGTILGIEVADPLRVEVEASPRAVAPSALLDLNATLLAGGSGVPGVLAFTGVDEDTAKILMAAHEEFARHLAGSVDMDALTAYVVSNAPLGAAGVPAFASAARGGSALFEIAEGTRAARAEAAFVQHRAVVAYWSLVVLLAASLVAWALCRVAGTVFGHRGANAAFLATVLVFSAFTGLIALEVAESPLAGEPVEDAPPAAETASGAFAIERPLRLAASANLAEEAAAFPLPQLSRADLASEMPHLRADGFGWLSAAATNGTGSLGVATAAPAATGSWSVVAFAHTEDAGFATTATTVDVRAPILAEARPPAPIPIGGEGTVRTNILLTGGSARNATLTAAPMEGLEVTPLTQTTRLRPGDATSMDIRVLARAPGIHVLSLRLVAGSTQVNLEVPVRVLGADAVPRSAFVPLSAPAQYEQALPVGVSEVRLHAGLRELTARSSDAIHVLSPAGSEEAVARLAIALAARAALDDDEDDVIQANARILRGIQDVLSHARATSDGLILPRHAGGPASADLTARAILNLAEARAAGYGAPTASVDALARGLMTLQDSRGGFAGGESVTARAAWALAASGTPQSRLASWSALASMPGEPADPHARALALLAALALDAAPSSLDAARLRLNPDAAYSTSAASASLRALTEINAPRPRLVAAAAEILTRASGVGFGGALDTADALAALHAAFPPQRTAAGVAIDGVEVFNGEVRAGDTVTTRFSAATEGSRLAVGNTGPGLLLLEVPRSTPPEPLLRVLVESEGDAVVIRVVVLGAVHGPLRVDLHLPEGLRAAALPPAPGLLHARATAEGAVLYLDVPGVGGGVAARVPLEGIGGSEAPLPAWISVEVHELASGARAVAATPAGGQSS